MVCVRSTIKCCKKCVPPKRHAACHDSCPEYQAERAAYQREKMNFFEVESSQWKADSYLGDVCRRIKSKTKGQHYR